MTSEPEVLHIPALVHGRCLIERGADAGERAPLLAGFHGYGENARRHLAELRKIPGTEHWLRCAVAAPHPFYNRNGDVVGSWMTRQDREIAIDDNVAYTARALTTVRREHRTSDLLVIAGFSQGVAMAYRAAARCGLPCHGLIALAGDVPPDLSEHEIAPLPPILLGRGREDTWYTEEKMDRDLETLDKLGTEVETCIFDDGHVWHRDFLAAAGDFLDRLRNGAGAGLMGTG